VSEICISDFFLAVTKVRKTGSKERISSYEDLNQGKTLT